MVSTPRSYQCPNKQKGNFGSAQRSSVVFMAQEAVRHRKSSILTVVGSGDQMGGELQFGGKTAPLPATSEANRGLALLPSDAFGLSSCSLRVLRILSSSI